MRRSLQCVCSFLSPMAVLLCAASAVHATTDPILDVYGTSLPLHPPGGSISSTAPRLDQRGVDLDGTLRAPVPMGWSVAGDPLGGGYAAGRTLGDINLFTGSYHPTEVDLSFPTLGLPVVIGRTYSHVQQDGSGTQSSMPTVQGWNWGQTAQPEILLALGVTNDLDILYLYYGTDRFIEFKRIALNATEFKAKNGAAGVVKFTAAAGAAPETYTYYDQRGNQIVFLGFDGNAGYGIGQIWKMIDPAGNTAYVYDASSGANVGSTGYDAFGGVTVWYDASGHRYTFTYATFGIYRRIQKVECEINTGSWTSIGKVEYDYYTSTTNDVGLMGDLKTVTITQGGVSSGPYVRTKYYRYYTRAWSNSNGRRGDAHMLKMVVGFDGVRQEASYASDSDATLLPYSEMYFEYPSGDRRIASVTINGNCGCSGGTSGTYSFTYGDSSGYATAVANTSYDTGWGRRTIITQPDGTYVTQHFDETGAVLGRVVSAASPANWTAGSGSNKTWITDVERNGSGQVTAIHTPENITGYTHSTGAITYSSSVGLVTTYARHSASDNLDGLRDSVSVKEGTSGTAGLVSSVTMTDVQLVVGSAGVSTPEVTHTKTYPAGGSTGLDTVITTTYWSGTNTNVQYLAPKSISVAAPVVLTGSNGSGSATTTYRYLRTDGSTAYTKDAGGIISYSSRTAYGQAYRQIADCDTSSGDISTSGTPDTDTASGWSSLATSGTAIHAMTEMSYDDQGRILTRSAPSAGTPTTFRRVTTWKYVLDSARLGTLVSPRLDASTGFYHGPLSYSRVNHAGRPDRRATIEMTAASSIPTGTTPNTTSGTAWSALVDTTYDTSGMRSTGTYVYTSTSAHDDSSVDYDAAGRIDRNVDATGTIRRTVFDERGMAIERWMGTNDNGWTSSHTYASAGSSSGSSDMVKTEAIEYDNAPASGGGNGYLTKRTQDADGNWAGTSDQRMTTYLYDYRGRAIVALPPVAPYMVTAYDNSNRAVATAQYNSTSGLTITTDPTASSASTRVALSETAYDERGQVYQSTRWEINQSTGAKGSSQVTDNWYDADGRLVKTIGSQITKTIYDRLGRSTDRFLIAIVNDGSTYANALDAAGDTVMEQTHMALYPTTGQVLAQWLVQRAHDDTSTGGPIETNADALPLKLTVANLTGNARPQITAMWYDAWDRVEATCPYGTYGGSDFDRSSVTTAPATGANNPTTVYVFDTFGRMKDVQVPGQTASSYITNRTEYDFAGRKSKTTDNYVNGTPGGGSASDEDRVTEYAYGASGAAGLLTSMTKKMPSSGDDQLTTYTYGTTLSASQVATGHLPREIIYDIQVTSQAAADRTVTYTYNALSQVKTIQDPAGNVIATTYDAGGRVTAREATTIAGTFDSTVTRIETSYNSRGMVGGVLQKSDTPTTLDEVSFDFDGWGNMKTFTQDPDSAIGASGRAAYAMTWTYALGSTSDATRSLYLSAWTIPDGASGATITPYYNSGVDVYLHRVSLTKDGGGTTLGEYTYLGANTVAGMEYDEPRGGTGTWLYGSSGSSQYNTYMDRFNRPILVQWSPGIGVNPVFVDLALDYNVRGDNSARVDSFLKDASVSPKASFGYLTTFDSLRRMSEREEGELHALRTSVTTRARIETYARNLAGRLTTDHISLNSDDDTDDGPPTAIDAGEMDDTRVYNKRNELRTRSYNDSAHTGSPQGVTLSYDLNGNLTDDGEKYTYAYNPWGQLVQITNRLTPYDVQAKFRYNGLGQRIAEQLDTNHPTKPGETDGLVDSNDPWFFIAVDPQGRRVATFRDTDTYPKETFVYHAGSARGPSFAGGVQFRDRNASLSDPTKWATETASSTRGERLYYITDPQGSVIVLIKNNGQLMEQYRYSPTGVPFGLPGGNVKSDGVVNAATSGTTDYTIVNAMILGGYQARGDLNLDGSVSSADTALVTAASGASTGRGVLSAAIVGNKTSMAQRELFGCGFHAIIGSAIIFHAGHGLSLVGLLLRTDSGVIGISFDEHFPAGSGMIPSPVMACSDRVQLVCKSIAFGAAVHCAVRCCKCGSNNKADCTMYSLNPTGDSGGLVDRSPGQWRDYYPGSFEEQRQSSAPGLCACLQATSDANQNKPWTYNLGNCNSNWYASSLLTCCLGSSDPRPDNAVGWGQCCIDDWLNDPNRERRGIVMPHFSCPVPTTENHQYTRRCHQVGPD